jgi:hypothetical protein
MMACRCSLAGECSRRWPASKCGIKIEFVQGCVWLFLREGLQERIYTSGRKGKAGVTSTYLGWESELDTTSSMDGESDADETMVASDTIRIRCFHAQREASNARQDCWSSVKSQDD